MGHLDESVINKITHENAMAAYTFDPFRHVPKNTPGRVTCEPRPPTSTW